jgi:hypothetical protein
MTVTLHLPSGFPECGECRRPLTWDIYETPIMLKDLDTGGLTQRHAQADCICGCSWMAVVEDGRCGILGVRWDDVDEPAPAAAVN